MTLAIIIALLLGGGTSFAAEGALPGDVLYPIKIHVNENVQELWAVSGEAEAKVQAKLAERRLEEVERLAAEGKLTAETSADLKVRFGEHSEKSKERREKIKESDDEEVGIISSDTEVSLKMHEKLLEDLGSEKPEMKGFLGGILEGLHLHLKDASDDRIESEAKVFAGTGGDVKISAEGALKTAQNKIDEVKKFVDSKKSTLGAGVRAEADIHVKAANAAIAEGKAKIEARAYADAFALFKKAAREAQTAQLFATTAGNLNIELENHNEGEIDEKDGAQDTHPSDDTESSIKTEVQEDLTHTDKNGALENVGAKVHLEL